MTARKTMAALAVLAMLAVCPRALNAQGGWSEAAFKARRTLKVAPAADLKPDELVGVATFMTHGFLEKDGRDLRVVARNRPVRHRVLQVGPGDFVTVAFELLSGVDTCVVYYGNPKAEAPADDWTIRAGLLLEVRRYKGGTFNDRAQAEAAWAKSGDVEGVDFVPNVFFGYNPFGPSHSFMARYAGWLNVEKAGRYEFATSSTNASFLRIDGKDVVSWPGAHGAVGRARFTGTIALDGGRHRFEYLHVHTWGDPVAVAAWQPPGDTRPLPIPPAAFLPVSRAVVDPAQLRDEKVTPDFVFSRADAFLDPERETFVHRFSFRDVTAGITRRFYTVRWDFGDGIVSDVWNPTHVYLAPGTYAVAQQVKGPAGTFVTKQTFVVERDWSSQAEERSLDLLPRLLPVVKSYDFTKMPASSVAAACEFFSRVDAPDDLARVSRQLVYATADVPGELLLRECERLAGIYLARLQDPDSAVDVYLHAEKQIAGVETKADMALRAAAIVVSDAGDVERGETLYRRVLSAYPRAKPETHRRAMLGLAECAILSHQADAALAELQRADAISVVQRDAGGDAVRVGHLSRAIEDYLRRAEYDAAAELLDAWEWEYPLDRLVGYSTVLRARLDIGRGELAKAQRLLMSLVAVSPKSNYAGEALLLAGDAFAKLGDKARSEDTYKRVLRDYPESPYVEEAKKRLGAEARPEVEGQRPKEEPR